MIIVSSLMVTSLHSTAMENNRLWFEEKQPKIVEVIVHIKRSTDALGALGQISEKSDYSTIMTLIEAERAAYESVSKNQSYGQIDCPDLLDNCG
jgi:hypothetical protein